ncbi:MAG: NAD(P)-dependent alcohol dehydrogenase [Hyphomonadaceae bacterium]
MARAMLLKKPGGLDNLALGDADTPAPQRGEISVKLSASSLNYHDYLVVKGMIPVEEGRIPMSDGAGVVTAIGEGVSAFAVGDHVMSTFFPEWLSGEPTMEKLRAVPGDRTQGYARESVTAPATSFTKAPKGWTHEEAATLPCAGLTVWRALVCEGEIKAGDWVLAQGTGGVSIFAVQFAKMCGANVIATSSSDAKLQRLKALGADHVINYKSNPDWGAEAQKISGRGVDHVVEIGGPGTLAQSIRACRIGGHISMIGVLAGYAGEVATGLIMGKQIRLIGITVGSREQQEDMVRAIDAAPTLRPVIDKTFPLQALGDAFRHQESGAHFGKICISM